MKHYILGDVVDVISERENNPSLSGYERFVGLKHYVSGDVEIKKYGTTENLNSAMKVFKSGDILVARRNVYLKRASVVYFDGLTSGDSIVLRAKNENIGRLLPFILNTSEFWDYANQHSDGTMSKRLSPKVLKAYEFDLPDDNELEELADLLWSLVDTKNAYEELLIKTDDLVKSQFIEQIENDDRIPKTKLGELFDISSGGTPARRKSEYWDDGRIPWVKISDMKSRYVTETEEFITELGLENSSAKLYKAGTFLISIFATLGEVSILDIDATTNQAIAGMVPKGDIDVEYTYIALNQLKDHIIEIGRGAAQNNINLSILKELVIPMPEEKIRQEFSEFVQQTDRSKFELQQVIESTDNLIKSILHSNLEEKKE